MRAKPTATIELALAAGDFLWAIGSLCNLRRKLFDASLIQREFPPPHSALTLVEALRSLELDARVVELDARALFASALPRVVFLGMGGDETAPPRFAPALLAKVEDARVLVFPAGTNEPRVVPLAEFLAQYTGYSLEVDRAASPVQDDDASRGARGFGFRWFVAELLRHRRIWRDVLLASLVMQLIALATPLCSQVIIDKVIVHQTTSTLTVIASALAIFVVFGSALGWVRQYLVTHTGNRVDAVLGAAVFRHLMRLPLRFFERRPTGVLAARLNGVETIREFLSGAAITLLLDLPFLLLFLALMFFYSAWLSLVTLGVLALVVALSAAVAPLFQSKLNEQFLRGARNHNAGQRPPATCSISPVM